MPCKEDPGACAATGLSPTPQGELVTVTVVRGKRVEVCLAVLLGRLVGRLMGAFVSGEEFECKDCYV